MLLRIILIAFITLLGFGYIAFCYRRFKEQKIIEGSIPNGKLRMFWIAICLLLGGVLTGLSFFLLSLLNKQEIKNNTNTINITTGSTESNTLPDTQQLPADNTSGVVLSGGDTEGDGGIVSRTTLKDKIKHVPVSEKRGTSAQ